MGTGWGQCQCCCPEPRVVGGWQSSQRQGGEKFERSLVGVELEPPCSQALTLTVAHGASQMLAALAHSKPQLHLSPEYV